MPRNAALSALLLAFAALLCLGYGEAFVSRLDRPAPRGALFIAAVLVYAVFLLTALTTWILLQRASGGRSFWRYLFLGLVILSIRLIALILFGDFQKAHPLAVGVYQAVALVITALMASVIFPVRKSSAFGLAFVAILCEWIYSLIGIFILHDALRLRVWGE
jgi:hypothetical protein